MGFTLTCEGWTVPGVLAGIDQCTDAVEAMPDVQVLFPPFTADEVVEALGRLRLAPVLRGIRDEPPVDVQALTQAAVALGAMADELVSVDINPLRAGADGCAAVDALVIDPE